MLADPRSESLVTNFAAQWLLPARRRSQRTRSIPVPRFRRRLARAFEQETELFLDSILREDRSVLDLLTAELHVRQRTAGQALRHPQRPRQLLPAGRRFRQDSPRGGLLGQGSILTADVVFHADVAGAARQIRAGEPAGIAAASAAAQRSVAQDRRRRSRRSADHARGDGAASRQSGLRQLPCAHGPDRVRHGEFRRRRPVARQDDGKPIDVSGVLRMAP